MKKSLFFTLLVLLLCRCTIDPHDITSEYGPIPGRTALEYAYECEETLGPLPRFSFDDAIEAIASPSHRIKTTKQGIFQILAGWSNHYRTWHSANNFNPLLIRYEDMVRNPVKSFGRFVRFLGLPKNDERLKRAIRNSSFADPGIQAYYGRLNPFKYE